MLVAGAAKRAREPSDLGQRRQSGGLTGSRSLAVSRGPVAIPKPVLKRQREFLRDRGIASLFIGYFLRESGSSSARASRNNRGFGCIIID